MRYWQKEKDEKVGWLNQKGYKRDSETGKTMHRAVVEVHIGRSLLSTEIIHHRNGFKFDNRIENLQVVSDQEHRILHRVIQLKGYGLYDEYIAFREREGDLYKCDVPDWLVGQSEPALGGYLDSGYPIDQLVEEFPNIGRMVRRKFEYYGLLEEDLAPGVHWLEDGEVDETFELDWGI